ncbi:Hcp family type VI secretion system effector [Pontiella sp.]|uniref:Hcp family type VI secretion system effector n=1 Tax=Pontiella sp. TaxID=2837462 RepID=UPI003568923A
MFLKIEGIEGESRDDTHKDEIDVLSWSWGLSNSATTHISGGGGAGKASFKDLTVTKYLDKSSPALMTRISDGRHIPSATLVVRKVGSDPLEYLTITMTDIIVTSLSTGGSGGEDRLTENITLNFAEVEVEYIPQKIDGSTEQSVEFGWDIQANIPK